MRYSPLASLALTAALVLPEVAAAQAPQVDITGLRIGFPSTLNRAGRGFTQVNYKPGSWAPLYVDLQVRNAPLQRESYALVVEMTDGDDMQNVYQEKRFLPTIDPKQNPAETVLTYVRIAHNNSELTVKVVDANNPDRLYHKKHLTQGDLYADPYSHGFFTYLTLGGKVSSLYKALVKSKQQGGGPIFGGLPGEPQPGADEPTDETGIRSFSHVDDVEQMPTYWFGYQGVDTAILLTGKQKFVSKLNSAGRDDPISVRREALAEWVHRGGRLVLSVSENHQEVKQILEQMKLIDLDIEGRTQVSELPGVADWAHAAEFKGLTSKEDPKKQIVEIAKLKPGPGVQVLAYDRKHAGAAALPVIVRAPCGIGEVIVVGFDLDQPPFTIWSGREEFWRQLKTSLEPSYITDAQLQQNQALGMWRGNVQSNELSGKLVRSLEAFPDVPVISFGWVALFILVYILIVGPLDYFFLKKVVKRLELTWITFPAVVIVISAVAYFAAYYLKGKDLRINKVDVVDVDLRGGHVYGNTWFTLFSPRIQNYTIGVEPGTGWGAEEKDPKKFSPFVSWMGRPEDEREYGSRGGSPGLFRRAYNYAPESTGLIGVPIQVWSTKTFSASWYRPIKDDDLIEADLTFAKSNPNKVSGEIKSHLPVELRDVAIFFGDRFYKLDKLSPGDTRRLDDLNVELGKGQPTQDWFSLSLEKQNLPAAGRQRGAAFNQEAPQAVGSYIKSILFHAYGTDNTSALRNNSLRFLDERWRLDNRTEVILFGRAVPPAGLANEGNAEELSQSGLSASKLWLGGLPGSGKRAAIDGTLSQETYVRIYIPVNNSK
jgi:hypothetical protein